MVLFRIELESNIFSESVFAFQVFPFSASAMVSNDKDFPRVKTKLRCGGTVCSAINCHNCHYNSTVSIFKFLRESI